MTWSILKTIWYKGKWQLQIQIINCLIEIVGGLAIPVKVLSLNTNHQMSIELGPVTIVVTWSIVVSTRAQATTGVPVVSTFESKALRVKSQETIITRITLSAAKYPRPTKRPTQNINKTTKTRQPRMVEVKWLYWAHLTTSTKLFPIKTTTKGKFPSKTTERTFSKSTEI